MPWVREGMAPWELGLGVTSQRTEPREGVTVHVLVLEGQLAVQVMRSALSSTVSGQALRLRHYRRHNHSAR